MRKRETEEEIKRDLTGSKDLTRKINIKGAWNKGTEIKKQMH